MLHNCRVCGALTEAETHTFQEFMFQSMQSWDYFTCKACDCLQISVIPDDMSEHYPSNYYSMGSTRMSLSERIRDFLSFRPSLKFLNRFGWYAIGNIRSVAGLNKKASIIDIGCGSGRFLDSMRRNGFRNLTGADPFIADDMTSAGGVRILKRDISQIDETFDVVMMHHSLEHMADQQAVIQHAFRILNPGGKLIIRIPTSDSWAYRHYGAEWAQIDPPRHFYLHSRKSIENLVKKFGFSDFKIKDDAGTFGLIGSEKIKLGLSPLDRNPLPGDADRGLHKLSYLLNHIQQGDMICVTATKP